MFTFLVPIAAIISVLMAALWLEKKAVLPTPVWMIVLAYGVYSLAPDLFLASGMGLVDEATFSKLVLALLPLLILSDTLALTLKDLNEHKFSLVFVAVIAIVASIGVGMLLNNTLFGQYSLAAGPIIFLFTACLATDPVATVSVFSKFTLPHRLKIIAEGESLFNDATAVIVVAYVALPLIGGEVLSVGGVALTSVLVIVGSVLVGIIVGFIGLFFMSIEKNVIIELGAILMTAIVAFLVAEKFYVILELVGIHTHHFHLSGILTIIVSILTLNTALTKIVAKDNAAIQEDQAQLVEAGSNAEKIEKGKIQSMLARVTTNIIDRERHSQVKEHIQFLALIANAVLFVQLGEVMNVDLGIMSKYWKEIIGMFVATTLIRAVMMGKFAFLSNKTGKMQDINIRWWAVLTCSGFKGGLSIVLVMMLPTDFAHLEMFRAVVVGVIALSTFVYSLALIGIISSNKAAFQAEYDAEHAEHH